MKLYFLIFTFLFSLSSYSMQAPPGCSQKSHDQRNHGYKNLAGVTALSAFAVTDIAVKNFIKNKEGESFTDEFKIFVMALGGGLIGMHSYFNSYDECTIRKDDHKRQYLLELSKKDALTFRKEERKRRLNNLAINSGMAALFSILAEDQEAKDKINIIGAIPIAMAGIQSLFISDKDLDASITLINTGKSYAPGIAIVKSF